MARHETCELLERTYELLLESPLTVREVAEGAGVGYEWLAKFKHRRIPSPGVIPVCRLHDFLSAYQAGLEEAAANAYRTASRTASRKGNHKSV